MRPNRAGRVTNPARPVNTGAMFGRPNRSGKVPPPSPPPETGESVRLTARVSGHVQGVGFRWTVLSVAQPLGLVGYAENLYSGDVEVVAEGSLVSCVKLLDWLRGQGPATPRRPGRVDSVTSSWGDAQGGMRSFTIR